MKSKKILKISIAVVITLIIMCITFALLLRPCTLDIESINLNTVEDALQQGISQ